MKIILCGYNWAGCSALDQLLDFGYDVYVFTHESPPHIPSLLNYCKERSIWVSTENINLQTIPIDPDYICSIYYRKIISKDILQLVNY